MLFTSPEFILFFVIILLVYYCLSSRIQNIFLILVSYFFYGCWDWRFCGLLLFSTLLNYFSALVVHPESPHRRIYLCINITGNLALLGFFKYYNFFVQSLATVLQNIGLHPYLPVLNIILPVGISFYTFQMMGYTIDVYRGRIPATREFIPVAAFTCFFPQLLAGPIERAERMIPQFQKCRTVNADKISSGMLLILLGFFKKIAISDAVSLEVDNVFSHVATAPWTELIGGLLLYPIQLYCDFSGYSDIARGVARLLGFELMENFRQPFLSHNITELWRRWHISCSSWFRDYVYTPLAISTRYWGAWGTVFALFICFLLIGLWHGAEWKFIVFGILQGVALSYEVITKKIRNKIARKIPLIITNGAGILFTFGFFSLCCVFIRAHDISDALTYLKGIVLLRDQCYNCYFYFVRLSFFVGLLLMIDIPQYSKNDPTVMLKWPWVLQGGVYGLMVILMLLLAPGYKLPFIYFQF